MSEINKKNSSKKKIKKKRVKRTYSEGPYESVENVYKKLAVEHELSISLTKWDQGRIRDKKSTFGMPSMHAQIWAIFSLFWTIYIIRNMHHCTFKKIISILLTSYAICT